MEVLNVLIELYKEQMSFCRHNESQRAVMTNIVVIITAVLLGFTFGAEGYSEASWPFPALVIVIGVYSYFFSRKQYERFKLHDKLSDEYRAKIELLLPDTKIDRKTVNLNLKNEFGIIHTQSLNAYWRGVPVVVSILGIGSLIAVLTASNC